MGPPPTRRVVGVLSLGDSSRGAGWFLPLCAPSGGSGGHVSPNLCEVEAAAVVGWALLPEPSYSPPVSSPTPCKSHCWAGKGRGSFQWLDARGVGLLLGQLKLGMGCKAQPAHMGGGTWSPQMLGSTGSCSSSERGKGAEVGTGPAQLG